ncbi:50S ribosomal protein L16 [Candidatus Woesearchaeota archaeon]|nr:50S ribosomal protein L16 [Candidatus Woesearchaeota archaeon]
MAKLRKFSSYKRLERPYTRVSKFKKKSYIKGNPHKNIVRFEVGNSKKEFDYTLYLTSKTGVQIRDNALESARQTCNRLLEPTLGLGAFFIKLRIYPFQILRENPLASGAGADRFSTGMQKSFGKPIANAAQVKKGQTIFEVRVDKVNLDLAKKSLQRALKKIPCSCIIKIIENKKTALAE